VESVEQTKKPRKKSEIDQEYTNYCAYIAHKQFLIKDLQAEIAQCEQKATELRREVPAPEETPPAPNRMRKK
jgi:hypothetical protein